MSDYPMTKPQRDLIHVLRRKENISPDFLDQLCQRLWELPLDELSVRQASALIHSLKDERDQIKREIQMLAGQRSLL